ncbi:MAG TPA: DUF3024 domain-containing protein [Candidatus Limnocylindria bacterium]|nr:DUF3024 domain-containing protein [Candidatus Limnocylindria bacterium]
MKARADRQMARFCATHLPVRARTQVRLEHAWRGNDVTLIERRAPWDSRGDWTSQPIARFRYDATPPAWRVFWQRANGRWLEIEGLGSADLGVALAAVGRDHSGVFWG